MQCADVCSTLYPVYVLLILRNFFLVHDIGRASIIIAYALVFILTLMKTIYINRLAAKLQIKAGLAAVLLRDGNVITEKYFLKLSSSVRRFYLFRVRSYVRKYVRI